MTTATKLGMVVTYNKELDHMVLQGHVKNQIRYISTTRSDQFTRGIPSTDVRKSKLNCR